MKTDAVAMVAILYFSQGVTEAPNQCSRLQDKQFAYDNKSVFPTGRNDHTLQFYDIKHHFTVWLPEDQSCHNNPPFSL
jgi:hypothetical protein